jgi:hypothetical protein
VLLGFAVIVAWEKFRDAETAVLQEASAAATIYRLAAGPDPDAVTMRTALGNYLRVAIDRDWMMMAEAKESHEARQALAALYAVAIRATESGSRHPAIFAEVLKQLEAITQSRRVRLHLAIGIVPGILWWVLYGGGALTVAFTFFFGTKNLPAQVMMTGRPGAPALRGLALYARDLPLRTRPLLAGRSFAFGAGWYFGLPFGAGSIVRNRSGRLGGGATLSCPFLSLMAYP